MALLLLCSVLGVLQYHWTGELARSESERLKGNIEMQSWQFCRQFDDELAAASTQLRPSNVDSKNPNLMKVYEDRIKTWLATKPQPMFSRIAVAVETHDSVDLYFADLGNGTISLGKWPQEWEVLRKNLVAKRKGGSPPYEHPQGLLWETPYRGLNDMSWLIFELNVPYIKQTWLPDMVGHHFNFAKTTLYEVTVRAGDQIIYSTHDNTASQAEKPSVMGFNIQGQQFNRRMPLRRPAWQLEVARIPEALEEIVASARTKNLVIAMILNVLILTAGVALLRHSRRSRQLAESQMNFVANVSHELRTPLTVIKGASHNLKNGLVNNPSRINQYATLISQHTSELQDMVEQILEYAGTKSNARIATHEPLSLKELLNDTLSSMTPDAIAEGCVIETNIAEDLPLIKGDAASLRRVLQNLISNAIKHAGSGKWVGVKATSPANENSRIIELSVSDHGPGIPLEEQAKIFEPFVRGSVAQAAQIRGSGIGLGLVREIIQAHGGNVTVMSHSGEGATFTIQIPAI